MKLKINHENELDILYIQIEILEYIDSKDIIKNFTQKKKKMKGPKKFCLRPEPLEKTKHGVLIYVKSNLSSSIRAVRTS